MKASEWLLFLKYPYATIVIAAIWAGSATMIFVGEDLPVLPIAIINVVASWVIAWSAFRRT